MLDALPAELLERVFVRTPLLDLLACMTVNWRLHLLARRSVDWEVERRRSGLNCGPTRFWHGRHMSTGAQQQHTFNAGVGSADDQRFVQCEVNNEQHLEALAELARSLSVERELNKLCGPGPAAPPVSRTEAIATRFARDFNGADLAVSAVNYQSIPVMDPRRWPWRGENHFHLPLKGFTRTEYFLRLDAQTAVLVAHRHATRELVLYHLQLGREQPLAEQVLSSGVDADTGNVSRSFKSEDRWVINVQSSIPHSRLCIFLWGNRTGRRALVFSVPGMQRLANVALPTFADFGAYLQSVRTPSDFFYSHQDRSLMRFDIRTARLRRECLLPGRADFYSVSEDRKQVVVFCEHLLFEAAAHDDPDRHRCSLRAVRQMDGRYVAHHRDGHVLALPDRSNPNPNLYVFDMDLNMLWCVDGFFGFSSACFVGENQLVSSDGLVFDWRRRRRYLGQVKYDLAVRINKRPGAPCEHVCFAEYGPCLSCFEARTQSTVSATPAPQ